MESRSWRAGRAWSPLARGGPEEDAIPARRSNPGLIEALDRLIEPFSRGDPGSPLRWTCKSTRSLARELAREGFTASSTKVGSLLKSEDYSLQSNRKTIEGKQHPDRNAQFEHIARRVKARHHCGEPAISVDTKKKEPLGRMKNAGKTYQQLGTVWCQNRS